MGGIRRSDLSIVLVGNLTALGERPQFGFSHLFVIEITDGHLGGATHSPCYYCLSDLIDDVTILSDSQ